MVRNGLWTDGVCLVKSSWSSKSHHCRPLRWLGRRWLLTWSSHVSACMHADQAVVIGSRHNQTIPFHPSILSWRWRWVEWRTIVDRCFFCHLFQVIEVLTVLSIFLPTKVDRTEPNEALSIDMRTKRARLHERKKGLKYANWSPASKQQVHQQVHNHWICIQLACLLWLARANFLAWTQLVFARLFFWFGLAKERTSNSWHANLIWHFAHNIFSPFDEEVINKERDFDEDVHRDVVCLPFVSDLAAGLMAAQNDWMDSIGLIRRESISISSSPPRTLNNSDQSQSIDPSHFVFVINSQPTQWRHSAWNMPSSQDSSWRW